jgi:hypothetical protein
MIIIEKKNIIPIIIPQICFIDRFNNVNNYVEMNPSLDIDTDGNVIILVRCVNYKKCKNNKFTLYQNISNSSIYE